MPDPTDLRATVEGVMAAVRECEGEHGAHHEASECTDLRTAILSAMKAALESANAKAEAEMLRTHVLEGAHGRGIATVLAELDAMQSDQGGGG